MRRPTRITPGLGQESVWDYPRPPRVEPCTREVVIVFSGRTVATSDSALRVLETSSPPTIYVPQADIDMGCLVRAGRSSFCEWKGAASYYDLVVGDRRSDGAAWFYERPNEPFAALAAHVAFYPGRVDAAYLDGELVRPQAGSFYGGWITDDIVGPFKGEPGTSGW